eukprot:2452292-Prorocentrum_lima.AAC.1
MPLIQLVSSKILPAGSQNYVAANMRPNQCPHTNQTRARSDQHQQRVKCVKCDKTLMLVWKG